jgi:acetyl-CoA acetyltransferase
MLLKRRGLRLLLTLHDCLAEVSTPGALGLATLCVGGGQGVSVLVCWVEL